MSHVTRHTSHITHHLCKPCSILTKLAVLKWSCAPPSPFLSPFSSPFLSAGISWSLIGLVLLLAVPLPDELPVIVALLLLLLLPVALRRCCSRDADNTELNASDADAAAAAAAAAGESYPSRLAKRES